MDGWTFNVFGLKKQKLNQKLKKNIFHPCDVVSMFYYTSGILKVGIVAPYTILFVVYIFMCHIRPTHISRYFSRFTTLAFKITVAYDVKQPAITCNI